MKAVALYSGGLDSILACRMIMYQGIEVLATQFVTPFFLHHLLDNKEFYCQKVADQYGITLRLEDISHNYLHMLQRPAHGFGKNFNPCIDCKILMMRRARQIMEEVGASFLISGEVLRQRPMSQRRDTLAVIERDAGVRGILLRPLSAKRLNPTLPEVNGWVRREELGDLSGRGRSGQIALAKEYGITDYPMPAGGCILTDPIQGRRLRKVHDGALPFAAATMTVTDFHLLQLGRQFLLPGGGWLILGRDEKENNRIENLAEADDACLRLEARPGPTALLRRASTCYKDESARNDDLQRAAGLVVRYARKEPLRPETLVRCLLAGAVIPLKASAPDDEICQSWML
ncbi:MAG: thiamine biosynthesis protein [Desulfobulbaceae bacterium]|jgi:tRNA U34 2-thiouridine synthase MnmA/TrmU|nr:thiamine biosynthesis protein [Desulfobulbaceae bacterium]